MLKENIDIGPLIKEIVEKRKMTVTDFSLQCGFPREYAYTIFKQKSIDTYLLCVISNVLNHNFLLEYFEEKPINRQILIISADDQNIDQIKADLLNDKSLIIIKVNECV